MHCRIPLVWRVRAVGRPLCRSFARDVWAVAEHAEAAVALATEQGFPIWAALGTTLRGWALTMQGQGEAGMAQVRGGIAGLRDAGAALSFPYLCTVLAEVYLTWATASRRRVSQALAEAHTLVEQHEERYWEAEICRLRGVLLLRQPDTSPVEAEAWLRRALDIARRQAAKALELRAAHEPEPPVAAAGQAPGSLRLPGADALPPAVGSCAASWARWWPTSRTPP